MEKREKRPRMKDVADLVGVSVQTVSAVINNKPGITPETQQRVLEAVEALGYRPYSVARSLRTGQTRTLALIVSDIANPSFATIASAGEDHAHQAGYTLMVYNTHDDIDREAAYVQIATQRWIDGVLFVSAEDRMTSLDAFEKAGIPSIAIDRIPEGYDGFSVTLDNEKAGRMVARYLLNLGHRHLAHISGPLRLRLARERLTGFTEVIEDKGIAPGLLTQEEGDWTCQSGYEAMKKILTRNPEVTAVFCANDRMAIGAARAINEAGLRVPEDLSLIGVDDIEVSAFQAPPLTTIRQSFADLATLAVQLLLDVLSGEEPEQTQIEIEPMLVERESTAPPAKGKSVDR